VAGYAQAVINLGKLDFAGMPVELKGNVGKLKELFF